MKKKISKTTSSIFNEYSEQTQLVLNNITNYLKNTFSKVNPEWLLTLDMLATNLDLYFQCKNEIKNKGLMYEDRFGVMQKSPLIKVMNDACLRIEKYVSELGISPKASKQLNLLDNENNTPTFLDKLLEDNE